MSLSVYTTHNGGCYKADPSAFDSLPDLKAWIEQNTGLAPLAQIIMSGRGTAVKLASLINETEIYVFDRRLLDSSVQPRLEPIPNSTDVPNAPTDLHNERDLGSWKALFERRVIWADMVVSRAASATSNIQQIESSLSIMKRGVVVAFENLEVHYGTLKQSAQELREWADGTLKEQNETLSTWERSYGQLSQIPLHERLGALAKTGSYGPARTLQDLFKPQDLQRAANDSEKQARIFVVKVTECSDAMIQVGDEIEKLGKEVKQYPYKLNWDSSEDGGSQMMSAYGLESQAQESQPQTENEAQLLLHDMKAVASKVRSDFDRLNSPLPGVPITLSQVSKWALVATKELLPALANLLREVLRHHQQCIEQKNKFIAITAKYLQSIATIQSRAQPAKGEVENIYTDLNLESEGYHQLHTLSRLPLLYGSLLIECVRRKEWQERLAADSRRMAEEFALLKEDEEKKRRKFQRTTGELLPFKLPTDSTLSAVDLNMRSGDDKPWPMIARQDVESYIQRLRTIDGMDVTINELTAQFTDLDKPAKRRSKQTRGFKMGSVHEANLASSSFFPDNDMSKLLREEKARSLEKARNYEIRIKKLEELAYRNISRNGPGAVNGPYPLSIPGTPLSQQQFSMNRPQSPSVLAYPDSPSRPASVNSRRFSFVDPSVGEKEKQLTARISALEQQLAAEQDKTARLEKDIADRIEGEKGLQARISEGESTKRDLVANLESLQAGFNQERKSLTSTIEELRQKLYDAEEELYKADELRAQEESKIFSLEEKLNVNATDFEQKVKSQEEEIARINSMLQEKEQLSEQLRAGLDSWKAEVERKNAEIDSLSGALETERNEVNVVTAKLSKVEKELLSHVGDQSPIFAKAKQIHEMLSDQPTPTDSSELIDSIYSLVIEIKKAKETLADELQKAEEARTEKEAELSSAESRFNSRTQRAKEITNKLYSYNVRCIQLLEQLGFSVVRRDNALQIVRISRSNTSDPASMIRSAMDTSRVVDTTAPGPSSPNTGDINLLYWMDAGGSESESEKFQKYLSNINALDIDTFAETIAKRLKDAEHMARKYQRDARSYREKYHRAQAESSEKIAYKSFKEGDLALFLPTRNQATRPWAAFNVGAPHYFLREQDSHKLRTRDWLLARITKVEEKVVDLSRPTTAATVSSSPSSSRASSVNENPFELSDGLRWYFLDATEEKPGAPATPGLGQSTVASAKVDAKGSSVRAIASTTSLRKPSTATSAARKTLTDLRETESRRRSSSTVSTRPNSMALNHDEAAAVRAAAAATASGGAPLPVGTPNSGNSMMIGSPKDGGVLLTPAVEKRSGAMGAVEKFVGFMKGGDNHHE